MSAGGHIADHRRDRLLEEAVAQRAPAVLTFRSREGWQTVKCAFDRGGVESDSLVLTAPMPTDKPAPLLPQAGDVVGLTFRRGHKKSLGSALLRAVDRGAERVRFTTAWPEQLQQFQRRAFERGVPPRGTVIAVRFWREDPDGDTAFEQREVRHGQIEDLSAGGMRVKTADVNNLELGATYRCVFAPRVGAPALIVDAALRHRETLPEGRVSLGWQFIGLETTPEGRKALDRLSRIVSQFHRVKIRPRAKDARLRGE